MRFRLRTLLILLAVWPMLLAGLWFICAWQPFADLLEDVAAYNPAAIALVVPFALVVIIIAIWSFELAEYVGRLLDRKQE